MVRWLNQVNSETGTAAKPTCCQRPLTSAHGEHWGERGTRRPTANGLLHRTAASAGTPAAFHHLALRSIPRGWGAMEKRLADTRATLTDSGSLCCSRKAENSTSLSLVVPIDRPCHAGTEGAGADVGSNPKTEEPLS